MLFNPNAAAYGVASVVLVHHFLGFQNILSSALVLWIYFLDLMPLRYGSVQISLNGKGNTEVIAGLIIGGIQFGHFAEMADGFIQLPQFLINDADVNKCKKI